ncbi:hypothetical protein AKO1_011835 [Acrasis kona]|uniref:K Homology domain-containing protein n=1 Tax=Acrasis kona TaxID=1008807 RepID=A0AAW2Z859_9EUKA
MERYPIPSNCVGNIIGKGGCNIKRIKQESGATCNVKDEYVEIKGSKVQRDHAKRLIRSCVNNSIKVYSHPEIAILSFVVDSKNHDIKFVPFGHEGRSSNHINRDLYVAKLLDNDQSDDLSSKLSGLNLSKSEINLVKEHGLCLYNSCKEEIMDKIMLELIRIAKMQKVEGSASVDKVKVTTYIGTTTFYNSKKNRLISGQSIPLSTVLNYKIGIEGDMKVTFNNAVRKNTYNDFVEHNSWGEPIESEHFVMHLADNEQNERLSITLEHTGDELKLRKYKTKKQMTLYLNLINIGHQVEKYDVRFVISKCCVGPAPENISRFISSLTFNRMKNEIMVPSNSRYCVDVTRRNSRKRYRNGSYQMNCCKVENDGLTQHEIELLDVELNTYIRQANIDEIRARDAVSNLIQRSIQLTDQI